MTTSSVTPLLVGRMALRLGRSGVSLAEGPVGSRRLGVPSHFLLVLGVCCVSARVGDGVISGSMLHYPSGVGEAWLGDGSVLYKSAIFTLRMIYIVCLAFTSWPTTCLPPYPLPLLL